MRGVICVLGMHRSGTSLVARLLERMGVCFGSGEDLLPGNFANPHGYWELREIAETHDRLLQELDRRWDTAFPLPDGWHRDPALRPHRERLEEVIGARVASCDTFGWKDPRTCLTLPLWKDVLDSLEIPTHFVLVFRNPLDVASSLARRDGFEVHEGLGLWFHYNLQILTETAGRDRTSLRYEDLLDGRLSELDQLARELSLRPIADAEGGHEAIQADLCHSRSTEGELDERAPRLVVSLHRRISRALRREIPWPEVDAAARDALRELESHSALLRHDGLEATRRAERLEEQIQVLLRERAELAALRDELEEELGATLETRRARDERRRQQVEELEDALRAAREDLRTAHAELAEIHRSRWWKLADRYWRFTRRVGLTR